MIGYRIQRARNAARLTLDELRTRLAMTMRGRTQETTSERESKYVRSKAPVKRDSDRDLPPTLAMRPSEVVRLPPDERRRILEASAEAAEAVYRTTPELTDFEAFAQEDFFDQPDLGRGLVGAI